jgi:uncharacterized membrane protein
MLGKTMVETLDGRTAVSIAGDELLAKIQKHDAAKKRALFVFWSLVFGMLGYFLAQMTWPVWVFLAGDSMAVGLFFWLYRRAGKCRYAASKRFAVSVPAERKIANDKEGRNV